MKAKVILKLIWKLIKLLPLKLIVNLVLEIMEWLANQTRPTWDNEQVKKLQELYSKLF